MRKTNLSLILVPLLIITFLYFSFPVFFFPDSAVYYYNLEVLRGIHPMSHWQTFRGPSFSLFLLPFTFLLNDSMFSFLIPTYIFFIGSLAVIFSIISNALKDLTSSKIKEIVVYMVFLIFIVFNPVLFGYFHSLLTEFLAIFLGLVASFLSWKWIDISFNDNKLKYVIYNLAFILLIIFSWFLKQPYLSVTLFPLLVAAIISIIREASLRNIIQRILTVMSCLVFLFTSIFCWNSFLNKNNANTNSSDFNQLFLSIGIVSGISNLYLEDQIVYEKIDSILEDNFLSDFDKDKIKLILEGQSQETYRIYKVLSYSGEVKDKMVLYHDSSNSATKEAISFWFRVLKKHPIVMLDSYLSNYLGAINIYTTESSQYSIHPQKEFNEFSRENQGIGLAFLNNDTNLLWMSTDQIEQLDKYNFANDSDIIPLEEKETVSNFYLNTFKTTFALLPLLFIFSVYGYIKTLKTKDTTKEKYYSLILILLGLSVLHSISHVVTGSIIDRYFFIVFPEIILSLILLFIVGFSNCKRKSDI